MKKSGSTPVRAPPADFAGQEQRWPAHGRDFDTYFLQQGVEHLHRDETHRKLGIDDIVDP
jgi:hypothetical protein